VLSTAHPHDFGFNTFVYYFLLKYDPTLCFCEEYNSPNSSIMPSSEEPHTVYGVFSAMLALPFRDGVGALLMESTGEDVSRVGRL